MFKNIFKTIVLWAIIFALVGFKIISLGVQPTVES